MIEVPLEKAASQKDVFVENEELKVETFKLSFVSSSKMLSFLISGRDSEVGRSN